MPATSTPLDVHWPALSLRNQYACDPTTSLTVSGPTWSEMGCDAYACVLDIAEAISAKQAKRGNGPHRFCRSAVQGSDRDVRFIRGAAAHSLDTPLGTGLHSGPVPQCGQGSDLLPSVSDRIL